jgi:hypothetical protein
MASSINYYYEKIATKRVTIYTENKTNDKEKQIMDASLYTYAEVIALYLS